MIEREPYNSVKKTMHSDAYKKRQLLYCQLELQGSRVGSSVDYCVLTRLFRDFLLPTMPFYEGYLINS